MVKLITYSSTHFGPSYGRNELKHTNFILLTYLFAYLDATIYFEVKLFHYMYAYFLEIIVKYIIEQTCDLGHRIKIKYTIESSNFFKKIVI